MENPHRLVSIGALQNAVVEHTPSAEDDSKDAQVHVCHLRKLLGKDMIRTSRGKGYMFGSPIVAHRYCVQGQYIALLSDECTIQTNAKSITLSHRD